MAMFKNEVRHKLSNLMEWKLLFHNQQTDLRNRLNDQIERLVQLALTVNSLRKQMKDANHAIRHRMRELEQDLETTQEVVALIINHLDLHVDVEPAKEEKLVLHGNEDRRKVIKDLLATLPTPSVRPSRKQAKKAAKAK